MAALLALKSLVREGDMWIASNADEVLPFDDIVLQLGNVTYLLQLKHKDDPKPLKRKDLAPKGDHTLEKYLKGIKDLKKSLNCKNEQSFKHHLGPFSNMYFVFFTNRGINDCDFLEKLEKSKKSVLDILNTKSSGIVHTVNLDNFPNSSYAEEIDSYNKFYLLSNQTDVKAIDDKISKAMEKVAHHFKLCPSTNIAKIAEKFTKYVTDWAEGKFGVDYLLTRAEILQKVSELFLRQYEVNFVGNSFKCYNGTEKLTWNSILKDKKITLVEDGDNILNFLQEYIGSEVQKYCVSKLKSLWSTVLSDHDINALYEKHPHIELYLRKIAKTGNSINYFDIYKCLWMAAQIPLLVEVLSTDNYKNILNILRLANYCHKIVIVNKSGHNLHFEKGVEQVSFFASLNDVNERERNVILTSNISLQGRYPVVLHTVTDKSMLKFIKCKDIIQILCRSFNVGNNPTPLIDYFIERKISRIFIRSEVLDQIEDEQFVIEGAYEELPMHYMSKSNIRKLEEIGEQQEQATSLTGKPVHHFMIYNRKYFEWKASYGSLENIKPFVVQLENSEGGDILKTLASKKTLLCGIPGTGKSIVTDYIAHKAPTNKWIIKIDLNAHTKYYENQKKKTEKISDHLTYFNDSLHYELEHNVELTNAIFKRFRSSKDVIVLLDGFDEVAISYKKIVCSIARSFYNANCHVLITTRDHMQSHLEKEFDCLPVTLKLLSEEDQTKLISNYFSSKIPNSRSSISKFVKNLLKASKRNLSDHDLEFTGIPLLSKLLADVFLDKCRNDEDISNFNFDILYLYRTFIDEKIDIACKTFGNLHIRNTLKEYKKHYSLRALNLVFPNFKNIVGKLHKPQSFDDIQLKRLQEVGIITIDKYSNINFIHRTFGEYLAAKWLAKNVTSSDKKVKKIAQTLIKTRFSSHHSFLFNMFDRIVSQHCPLHTDILNGRTMEVSKKIKSNFNLIVQTDKCKRSILHLLLLYHKVEVYEHLQALFEDDGFNYNRKNNKFAIPFVELDNLLCPLIQPQNISIDIIRSIPTDIVCSIKPDELEYTPLDYAIQTLALNVANELIIRTKITYINATVPLFFKKFCLEHCVMHNHQYLFSTLLTHFAYNDLVYNNVQMNTSIKTYCNLEVNQTNISEFYIRNFPQQNISELLESNGSNIFQWYNNRHSNLHYVARFGTKTEVLQLLRQGEKINKSDNRYNTPLHYAVLRTNKEVLDICMESNAKLTKKNLAQETPLHLAIEHGNSNIVNAIINYGGGIDDQDAYGDTPLHVALDIQKYDIANVLITKGASVNIENRLGNNALHLITNCSYNSFVVDIMKKILPNIDDINKTNYFAETPLQFAALQNNAEAVFLLISEGASIHMIGNSYLRKAAHFSHTDIVKKILKIPINIHAQNKNEAAALLVAIAKNHLNAVKSLISEGASINMTDTDGDSALHIAAFFGHNGIVKEILKRKVKIDAQNINGATALFVAIAKNHLNVVKLLISKEASINITQNDGCSALHIAARVGHIDIVNEILKRPVNIHAQDKVGHTALSQAIRGNHLEVVKLLIYAGASINIIDNYGSSALHVAANLGHDDIVNEILKIPVNIHAQDKVGNTALTLAIQGNHLEVVKLLIYAGASINIIDNYGSALHVAAAFGHDDIVKEILKMPVNIDAQNKDKDTALTLAILGNHLEVVKLLIYAGASINIIDKYGSSALHVAANLGHDDIVKEILKMPVNIHAQDKAGNTALTLAIQGNHLEVVKLLIYAGASINIIDNYGSALHVAADFGHDDIVKEILKMPVNIHAQDKVGDTALYLAIRGNHLEVVKLLIYKWASINIIDNNGNSALHVAAYLGYNAIVNEILKMPVNIHAQDEVGDTALSIAIQGNHLEVVKLLIYAGASINIIDNYGSSALHVAANLGHDDIVNEILKIPVNIDAQDKFGDTALYVAIQGNHLEVVKLLIYNGASINIIYNNGDSALHLAAYLGHNDIVNEILKIQVNIDAPNKDGNTALSLAIKENHLEVVKQLIFEEASINISDNNGNSALHVAAYLGHNDIVKEILKMEVNIDAQNKDKDTALSLASKGNHLAVVKLLISDGASINMTDSNGNSALHVAAYLGHNDIVNEILKMPVNIDAQNKDEDTALSIAIKKNHLAVVKILISEGACINMTDSNGNSALHVAAYLGHNDIANEILKMPVNFDAQNKNGLSALWLALERNHSDVVTLLISKGAYI